jgi:hypothetical protein
MNHLTFARVSCAVATLALVAACGGGSESTPPPATPAPASLGADAAAASAAPPPGAGATQPGPGDWDKWTHDQKLAWMKTGVMPKMHDLFAATDAARYGDMSCKTCHGKGAADGTFTMPNPDLPKLDPTPAGFEKLSKTAPKVFDFMMKQVQPTMAGLVGEQPYDPKTKAGFGCFECHTKK